MRLPQRDSQPPRQTPPSLCHCVVWGGQQCSLPGSSCPPPPLRPHSWSTVAPSLSVFTCVTSQRCTDIVKGCSCSQRKPASRHLLTCPESRTDLSIKQHPAVFWSTAWPSLTLRARALFCGYRKGRQTKVLVILFWNFLEISGPFLASEKPCHAPVCPGTGLSRCLAFLPLARGFLKDSWHQGPLCCLSSLLGVVPGACPWLHLKNWRPAGEVFLAGDPSECGSYCGLENAFPSAAPLVPLRGFLSLPRG